MTNLIINSNSEQQEQIALFNWAEQCYKSNIYPELELLHAIPNGGYRKPKEAKLLVASGVKSGVPDIFLPVPKGKYHGLYIELKVGKNKTSKNQNDWLYKLNRQGYGVKVCYGANQAKKTIEKYLALR